MARPTRIDFPGAFHHVMNRSSKGTKVFENDDICSYFLDVLGETAERFDIRVHGYALMPNHYHLLVESVHGNLSRAMSHLNGRFTPHTTLSVMFTPPAGQCRFFVFEFAYERRYLEKHIFN